MKYGLQPQDYVSTWRSVTNAIRAVTNETFTFWAPNVMPDVADDDVQAYEPYWPGEEYVDVVGLSVYSFGPQRSINQVPPDNEFRNSFQKFYDLVSPSSSSSSDNPLGLTKAYEIAIAETSVPYYYEVRSFPHSPSSFLLSPRRFLVLALDLLDLVLLDVVLLPLPPSLPLLSSSSSSLSPPSS